ncbi:hypothetical protein ACWEOE_36650 [Amycolatopsis sp. NPDC004368]
MTEWSPPARRVSSTPATGESPHLGFTMITDVARGYIDFDVDRGASALT